MCKKDPSFKNVYDKTVRNFLMDYMVVSNEEWRSKYIKVISCATTVHIDKDNACSISKIRVKAQGKGSSESPRIWIANVVVPYVVIPLTIYTHSDAKTKSEPTFKALTKLREQVIDAYVAYLENQN
ncbi:MAG: hypothetical protein LBR38_07250 [Synergistaceae bacterium]|nr:hypothetical protein [Synergistaceae bacterium]